MHKLSDSIDGGNIIFQTSVKLKKNDGIHDSNCRALITFIIAIDLKVNKIAPLKLKPLMNPSIEKHIPSKKTNGNLYESFIK